MSDTVRLFLLPVTTIGLLFDRYCHMGAAQSRHLDVGYTILPFGLHSMCWKWWYGR